LSILDLLCEALRQTRSTQIIDLCSGASGPWGWFLPELQKRGLDLRVVLSDKYPNLASFEARVDGARSKISYHPAPVDAIDVPKELNGFRTIFTAFHHFKPDQAREILADAVGKQEGIAIFEITERRPLPVLFTMLAPLSVFVTTPFMRPFRWSRLVFTYLLPLVPLVALFDGLVSCARSYSEPELRALVAEFHDYQWQIGRKVLPGVSIPISYLIGIPHKPLQKPNSN